MSSITTAIPTGVISNGPNWCIQGLIDIFASDTPPYTYNECANSTTGTQKSSFETFCCDGTIIDTSQNLWGARNYSSYELDISNLVCCRAGGQLLPGGIMPIDPDNTHCSASMRSAPLASLAATNTDNAVPYLVTYESASQDSTGGLGDWTVTETPTCLWIETKAAGVSMVEVTVAAAQITTLPPPTTDRWGNTIVQTSTNNSAESTGSAASGESGTASARSTGTGPVTKAPSGTAASSIAAAVTTSAAESLRRVDSVKILASVGLCLDLFSAWML